MTQDPAVIVIGGGMAGLAAACELGRAGLSVCILEARDRMGGRVFTVHDSACQAPIELGAEFIHGRPPEIWDTLKKAKAKLTEVSGENWCVSDGRLSECELFSEVDSILDKMDDSVPDESFLAFLERCFSNPKSESLRQAKQRAIDYVTGFNAADPGLAGVHWLVQGMRAEEKIEGDRAFRSQRGYKDLLDIFCNQAQHWGVEMRTETVVETVTWREGQVKVSARSATGSPLLLEAPITLVTLPLSLLNATARQPGMVAFEPQLPAEKIGALGKLEMGKVIRVTLRFRERFWNAIKPPGSRRPLDRMSFLFSQDEWFPTWWTSMPQKSPIITGWAPFRCAERLSGQSHAFVVERSLHSLGELLKVSVRELEGLLASAHLHDWQSDPFSRGAYSYGKVGAEGVQQILAAPLKSTLFFAGEATDTSGYNGTVHGAIASGQRAAAEILRAR